MLLFKEKKRIMKRSISFLLVLVVLLNLFAVTHVYAKDDWD